MKAKKHAEVKIDPDLMAEFSETLIGNVGKYGYNRTVLNEEQVALIKAVYAKKDCNRKAFAAKFQQKYGISGNTLRRAIKDAGIEVESDWHEKRGMK